MKKYYYSLFAAASMMLAVTSCSQEEDFPQSSSEMTKFSVSLNGAVGSRAAGDGKTAKNLYYEVYHGTNCIIDKMVTFEEGKVEYSIDVPLLRGEKYDIIFWAQAADGSIYDAANLQAGNLKTISVDYGTNNTVTANQEAYDAFYNALNQFEADGKVHTIELRRPFAQLNLGTSDWEKAKDGLPMVDDGNGGTKKQYPVTATKAFVKGLATTFSPLTGEAAGTADVTFDYAKLPVSTFDVEVNGVTTKYKYLSLNYLLVPGTKAPQGLGSHDQNGNKTNVDIEFALKRGETELFTIEVPNAPIQRNWRTNVIGDLLTGNRFDVVIKPEPDDDNNVDVKNIKSLDDLKTALEANQSTEQVIYDISGLSTTDNVTIDIPTTFVAAQVTFNFNDIKDDANLTIKDANGGSYANTVCVSLPTTEGHNLTTTIITLPNGHVELLAGNFGNGTVTTSPTTLVVNNGATIGTLTINGGNVEIQTGGDVESITVSEDIETPIIVALGEGVEMPEGVEDNEKIIVAGTDNAESSEETVYVAQVGDYKYTSLEDALTVIAETGEIKMLANYVPTSSITIPFGKTITLDLNGMTISQTVAQTSNYQMILNDGNLTIQDSKGGGKISYVDSGNGGEYVSNTITNRGTLTVKSGSIENNSSEAMANTGYAYAIDTSIWGNATETIVNIEGGEIKSTYSPLRVRADSDTEKVEANISGGTLYGRIDHQMSNSKAGVIGILNISGGTFKKHGIKETSLQIFGAGVDSDASGIVANITGGDFEGDIVVYRGAYVPLGKNFNENFISGGTFAEDPSDFLAAGYLTKEENSKYIVYADEVAKIGNTTYPTLNKAIEAVNDGGTITLLKNEIFTEKNRYNNGGWWDGLGYSGDKSFTIDLGGNTISQEDGALNDYLMWFKNDGSKGNTITLKNGTLDAGTTAYCAFATASSNAQKITINTENITFVNNHSYGAVLKIRGGSELNVNAGTIIEGKDSYVGIEAVGNNTVVNIYDGAEIYQKGTSSYVGAIVGASYNATMNIYGGYGKSAKCGIIVMSTGATINVSGGEWIANNDGTVAGGNQGVLVSQNNRYESGWACKSVMNVTGGTFKGGYDCWGSGPGQEPDDAQINIKGGNFNADPTQYVVAGYEVTGNYTVGKPQALVELESAIAKGGNVTLTNDVTLLESLKIENTVVLDLNGKTITAPLFSAFEVKAGGDLTLKNGKVVAYESTVRAIGGKAVIESGEYTSTGTAVDSPATNRYSLDCREGGELIVNGGTFKSNNGMINVGSTVTINGGKFENIVEKSMTRHFAYVSALLTINDGEFYGKANSSAGGCFFCGAAEGCDIQVKGGKFTSLWTSGSVNKIFESYYGGTINVTGGLFNTNGGIASFVTENTDAATKDAYPYVAK